MSYNSSIQQSIFEHLYEGRPISSFDRERAQHLWWNRTTQQFEYIEEDYQLSCSEELLVTAVAKDNIAAVLGYIEHIRIVDTANPKFWEKVLTDLSNTQPVDKIEQTNPCA